jgi:Fur family transcriptional regulator, peroxide stress response regulator
MIIIINNYRKSSMEYRNTRQRDKIYKVLMKTRTHPSADWVYKQLKEEMPELSLGTVYRNLRILKEQGKIQELPCGRNCDRYDADISNHYHLVCENCGAVDDVDMPEQKGINAEAEKRNSCTIKGHRIVFFGLCKECKNKQSTSKKE